MATSKQRIVRTKTSSAAVDVEPFDAESIVDDFEIN
jgi:hypothetical protein